MNEHDEQGNSTASDNAKSRFGWLALIFFLVGLIPGLQFLWVLALLSLIVSVLVAPAVGHLEEKLYREARETGGGGCTMLLIVAILLMTAVLIGSVVIGMAIDMAGVQP
jgi:predicted PurR-regulated permease PerM